MKFTPKYDEKFTPLSVVLRDYRASVKNAGAKTLSVCVERNDGYNYVYKLDIYADDSRREENYDIAERIIKSILWVVGGYKIYIGGDKYVYEKIKADYTLTGKRAFDVDFMQTVYEKPFEVVYAEGKDFPEEKNCQMKIGGHLDGCRIGFDAGGSDRKVSAVVDGKVVYSEEVVWFPKINSDWHYHYDGIMAAMKTAASKMPCVDAIGVSSAGVYINNKIMVASLFLKVPKEDYKEHVQPMYINIAKELGAPLEVANDGDVTALAGAIDLKDDSVLGIAMGTSEAVGYINDKGLLNGWLSEVAFVPVDFSKEAMVDEWSGDYGCGVKYFSQDGVIKLAESAGYKFPEGSSPAEKLKVVQKLMENGDPMAKTIYEDIGIYLGYAIPYYSEFYKIKHLLILGRVTSGEGGAIIIEKAKEVLKAEFPEYADINITMPDESNKRVGQSIAAASLPEIK
ncbi:MAG TPA: transcriptional regulator [Clostridiales bacterium]|nr:transcriptional regulator [Clostridiales bacterium]